MGCLVYERGPRPGWCREGRTLVRRLPFVDRKNHVYWSHVGLSVLDYLAYRRRGDVLHVHNVQNSWLCPLFKALGHRVVFHVHGQEWRVAKWGRSMSLFMRLSILPMLLFADVVVTVCEESRRLLAARCPWWAASDRSHSERAPGRGATRGNRFGELSPSLSGLGQAGSFSTPAASCRRSGWS